MFFRKTHPQPGEVPEPAAPVPGPPRTTVPAAPPASEAVRSSPGCGGRTPASAQSGLSWHVQAEKGRGKSHTRRRVREEFRKEDIKLA